MDNVESVGQPNRENERPGPWEVVKGIFYLAAGIAIIVFLINKTINTVQVMTGKNTAKATVISTDEDVREWNDGNDAAVVTIGVYKFTVNGHEYFGKTEVKQGSLSEGDQLTIKYNSNDPTRNRVIRDRAVLGDLFTFMLFGGFAAYFLIATSIAKYKSYKAQ